MNARMSSTEGCHARLQYRRPCGVIHSTAVVLAAVTVNAAADPWTPGSQATNAAGQLIEVVASSTEYVPVADQQTGFSQGLQPERRVTWSDGSTSLLPAVGGYAEVASGLSFKDGEGHWQRSSTTPSMGSDGSIVFGRLPVSFRFAPSAHLGTVVEAQREGRVLARSAVAGLCFHDRRTGTRHVFAWVKPSTVQVYEQGVFYADAFAGAQADIRYKLDTAKLQQDLVIYALPDPGVFGLDPASVELCVLTEINDVSLATVDIAREGNRTAHEARELPVEISRQVAGQAVRVFNFQRSFAFAEEGDWVMGAESRREGKALAMRLLDIQGRVFLVEQVAFASIADAVPAVLVAGRTLETPVGPLAEVPPARQQGRLAAETVPAPDRSQAGLGAAAPRFVLDYVDYYGTVTNDVRFKTSQTYFISSDLVLSGSKLIIEPGCVLKFATNAQIRLQSGASVECRTHAANPALFTTVHDNAGVGEYIVGYTNNPASNLFAAALSVETGTNVLEGLKVRYAKVGVSFASPAAGDQWIKHSQFHNCERAVEASAGNGAVYVHNCLVKNGSEGVWANTNAVYVRCVTFDGLTNWAVETTGNINALHLEESLFANISGRNFSSNALGAPVGYVSNATYLAASDYVGSVLALTNSPFQAGTQGTNYLNQTSVLINAGSVSASAPGYYLHHFSTATSQTKESNTVVDIGFHYASLSDKDGDKLYDVAEDRIGDGLYTSGSVDYADWNVPDTDGDGMYEGWEFTNGTNPQVQDTDGDGLDDWDEYLQGSDPLNSNSVMLSIAGGLTYTGAQAGYIFVVADYEPGLVLSYPFSESNAYTVSDLSGMSHTGAVLNGAQWISNGYRGGAYQFDGVDDHLIAGKPPGLTSGITNQFTLSCWINPSNDHEGYIVGRAQSSFNDLSMYLNDGPDQQGINYTLKRQGGPEHFLESGDGGWSNIPNGTWTHIAATFGGTVFRGFVNGQMVVSSNISGNVDDNGNDFVVGDRHTQDRPFRGQIDDVRVYNRGLTESQVYTLYTSGVFMLTNVRVYVSNPTNYRMTNVCSRRAYRVHAWRESSGGENIQGVTEACGVYSNNPILLTAAVTGVDILLTDPDRDGDGMPDWWEIQYGLNPTCNVPGAGEGWWKFDEGAGTNITNSAGALFSGHTVNMGGTNWVAGKLGGALWFDGADDYVRVLQPAALVTGQEFTASGWMCFTEAGAEELPTLVSDQALCGGGYAGFWLGYDRAFNGAVEGLIGACGGYAYPLANTNVAGVWRHLAMTYSGSTARVYVDGVERAAGSNAFAPASNSEIRIGWADDPTLSYHWNGRLDDVRLYTNALSSTTISNLYDAFQDADSDGLNNLGEYLAGTSPLATDSDGDKLSDALDADPTHYDTNRPVLTITYPTNGMVIP